MAVADSETTSQNAMIAFARGRIADIRKAPSVRNGAG